MQPATSEMAYLFKLRDFSKTGLGILVKENSDILKQINIGDILEMKYYPFEEKSQPRLLKTQIRHISMPESGKHKKHMVVGLYIME